MIFLRKFYDTAAVETGGGDTAVIEEKGSALPNSIAAAMATGGVKNSTNEMVAEPIQIKKEEKEETKTTKTEAPAATAKVEEKVEKVETKETPKSEEKKEEKVVETPIEKAAPKTEVSWQEVLKTQPESAVLKAMGFDEKMTDLATELKNFDGDNLKNAVNLLKAVKEGKGQEYIKELSTDYAKMPAEDVMRHQLRKEYPKASEKAIDALYDDEVVSKYNLDSENEAELERGKLLLEAKADKYRDEFVENQKKFLIPQASEPKEVIDPKEESTRQFKENVGKQFEEHPYYKSVVDNNKITIGEGEEAFNFPIEDSKSFLKHAIDGGDISLFFDISGEGDKKSFVPKVEHNILVAAVNKYGMKFLDEYAKHFQSLGAKKLNDTIENAKKDDNKEPVTSKGEPKTAAEAMGKSGVHNPGGYRN